MDLKPGAPVKKTRQPYTLSKFDQARIAYHIEEQIADAQDRKLLEREAREAQEAQEAREAQEAAERRRPRGHFRPRPVRTGIFFVFRCCKPLFRESIDVCSFSSL